LDQLQGGSPEQVRNGYGIDRHPVLDIIGRYVDRNWNFQFPNDRQTDRINSAPAIVHSYNCRARRKPARGQSIQRISQRQNRIAFPPQIFHSIAKKIVSNKKGASVFVFLGNGKAVVAYDAQPVTRNVACESEKP
jgi:hypothetical protein